MRSPVLRVSWTVSRVFSGSWPSKSIQMPLLRSLPEESASIRNLGRWISSRVDFAGASPSLWRPEATQCAGWP